MIGTPFDDYLLSILPDSIVRMSISLMECHFSMFHPALPFTLVDVILVTFLFIRNCVHTNTLELIIDEAALVRHVTVLVRKFTKTIRVAILIDFTLIVPFLDVIREKLVNSFDLDLFVAYKSGEGC